MNKLLDFIRMTVQAVVALVLLCAGAALLGLLLKVFWKLFLTGWHVW